MSRVARALLDPSSRISYRRYLLVLLVVGLSFLLVVLPRPGEPLLSGGDWLSGMLWLVASYLGADTGEKVMGKRQSQAPPGESA